MFKRMSLLMGLPALILASFSCPAFAAPGDPGSGAGIVLILVFIVGGLLAFGLYLLPTVIAFARSHHNRLAIFAVNFLFGWILIPWIICLIWALTTPAVVVVQQVGPAPGQRMP